MKDRGWMEPIVERVVGQALESQAAQLRGDIVRRVMEELEAESTRTTSSAETVSADLARAVAEIQLGTSQREILSALLDAGARYAARIALFVVKGSHASGWQGRGFAQNDRIKDFMLGVKDTAVGRALDDRRAVHVPSAEADSRFLEEFGSPASGEVGLLPIVLKGKVAALVYADDGMETGGRLDAGSLELLVLTTSAWLEVNALRKQVRKETDAARGEGGPSGGPQVSPPFVDPFASHAPERAVAAMAVSESSPSEVPVAAPPVEAQAAAPEIPAEPAVEAAALDPLPIPPPESVPAVEPSPAAPVVHSGDQDVHHKAQRFARLLVDEIKLYNLAQVTEGRKNRDLYDRLKDTIEKSRATYQKRYGNTVAASSNYFQDEMIRSLAEDDISIMGANFRR
jgi:hypothetical protein